MRAALEATRVRGDSTRRTCCGPCFSAGRFELTKRLFRADELFTEVVGSFAPIYSQKNQKLVTDIQVGDTSLEADRERLGQVLANLVSNASKYSPAGKTRCRLRASLAAAAASGSRCPA